MRYPGEGLSSAANGKGTRKKFKAKRTSEAHNAAQGIKSWRHCLENWSSGDFAAKPTLHRPTEASRFELELTEGRYHQVKRMFASQGCEVIRLHRSRFGATELGDLPPGQWRLLPLPATTKPGEIT